MPVAFASMENGRLVYAMDDGREESIPLHPETEDAIRGMLGRSLGFGAREERRAILSHIDWLLEPGRCSDEERRLVAGIAGWIRSERRT